jgi:type III restriction enzyme
MKQVVTENPVINSPFDEPKRHFLFRDEGITNEIAGKRRTSSHFILDPCGEQLRRIWLLGIF